MRNVCLKIAVLTLALVGLAGSALRTEAQTIQTLVQFTNSWQYDQTGRQLPANWMTSAYTPDASWGPLSPGLLGSEPDTPNVYTIHAPILTPLSISGSVTTYYFRTTFNYAGSLANVALIATNLVDDGCAIYLNGLRVGGVRIPAGYNALNAALFFGGGTEGALETVTFTNVNALRAGANLLAVEVHQSSFGSSDVMFGMKLLSIVPTQLAITTQPQDETVNVGDTATFSVGVSGGPVTYRWYRGNAIQPSTSNTLNIANVQVATAGTNYYVVVSNIVNVVTSRLATLRVEADREGPIMLQAILNNSAPGGSPYPTNTINIIFDEALNTASAVNTNNYVLVSSTNSNIRIPIRQVQYSTALGALLSVDASNTNWNPAATYYVIVNNVADIRGNSIAPNSVIGVSIRVITSLTQMADTWNYYDCSNPDFCDPNSAAVYAGEAWAKTNFVMDPLYWGSGSGIFAAESGIPDFQCAGDTLRTLVAFQFDPTLFRRTFVLPTNTTSSGELRLRFLYDDAMAVYLNGELLINERCAVPITQLSRATGQFVAQATCSTNLPAVRVNNLRPGTNWLCAAVLQHATHEADTVFGFEMDLITLQTPAVPPPARLTMTRQACTLRLSWPTNLVGYTLQTKTSLNPNIAWAQVPNQSNPYTNLNSCVGTRFFRLFKP